MEGATIDIFVSQIIVLALGVTVIALAGWGLWVPEKLMTMVTSVMDEQWGIYIAVVVRLALGAALIVAAPVTPYPILFLAFGWIAIVAAVALALIGRERTRRFIVWWSRRFSAPIIRLWLLFGMAFAGFLIYGVL